MKSSRLSVLFTAAIVATSVLASTSKAQALTWNLTNIRFTFGGTAIGSFDYDKTSNSYSNINIIYQGSPAVSTFNQTSFGSGTASSLKLAKNTGGTGGIDENLEFTFSQPLIGSSSSVTGFYKYYDQESTDQLINNFRAGGAVTAVAVPFEIPGGATIPAVGGLLALGLMRKARKSIASKTRIANPVCSSVS